jgi:hypothetical protein
MRGQVLLAVNQATERAVNVIGVASKAGAPEVWVILAKPDSRASVVIIVVFAGVIPDPAGGRLIGVGVVGL